jgi:hypothetical protein
MHNIISDSLLFDIIFIVIFSIAMILWIYCIWFLNKYDKNANRLIMLLVLNIYYVPIYLFRIRKIRKEIRVKAISEEIYDSDFIVMSRNSIIETLKLWTSEEFQLELQDSDKDLNLLHELFQQWENNYRIDNKIIEEAFNDAEKELLNTFDESIITCKEKFKGDVPQLDEFQKTNDWRVLHQLAIEIYKEIK